jgi:hypothetical protein
MGEMRNEYNNLVGKPEEDRPLLRPRRRVNGSYGNDVGRRRLDSSGSG